VSPAWIFTTTNEVPLFYDSMETGGGRWDVETVKGSARWMLSDRLLHSGTYAWHMPSAPQATDARLATAQPVLVGGTSVLTFWHWYDMELAGTEAGDGGVLEISVDGGGWEDLGPYILSGGYDRTVAGGSGNPLAGRPAWSGFTDGWRQVDVDLGSFAGSSVRVRFRWGGNEDSSETRGWYVDDVQIASVWPPSKYKLYLGMAYRDQ
jgi:hypothetical protein